MLTKDKLMNENDKHLRCIAFINRLWRVRIVKQMEQRVKWKEKSRLTVPQICVSIINDILPCLELGFLRRYFLF